MCQECCIQCICRSTFMDFFLQDMSMSVALNNIQSVDRGEDEKVLYQMILFIPALLKH